MKSYRTYTLHEGKVTSQTFSANGLLIAAMRDLDPGLFRVEEVHECSQCHTVKSVSEFTRRPLSSEEAVVCKGCDMLNKSPWMAELLAKHKCAKSFTLVEVCCVLVIVTISACSFVMLKNAAEAVYNQCADRMAFIVSEADRAGLTLTTTNFTPSLTFTNLPEAPSETYTNTP